MVFPSIENNETFETLIILIAFMLFKIFFIFKTITNLQKSCKYHQNNFFFPEPFGSNCWSDGLLRWQSGKESACNGDIGDMVSIPVSGRSLGRGNGNPLQYSCLGNPMDRVACRAIVHSVANCWTWFRQLCTAQHISDGVEAGEVLNPS